MTQQVKMPEPVAYAIFAENGNIRMWSSVPGDMPDLDSLGPMHQLITTDQAEAYKDACVREALEGVIQSLEAETAKAREHKAYAAVLALMSQAELIRVQLHKQQPGPASHNPAKIIRRNATRQNCRG